MITISDEFIKKNIHFAALIEALKMGFRAKAIQSPPKSVYEYKGEANTAENTILLMPAWDNSKYIGTKLITATPYNSSIGLPYLQGIYILFDAKTGTPLAHMDAKLITSFRTAATSALAADYLAKQEAKTLLVMGNGNLAPYFIEAHASVRNYEKIYLWGRRKELSENVKKQLLHLNIEVISDYKGVTADVISCVTSSDEAFFDINDMLAGQHYDLSGSFTPSMHEVSSELLTKASTYCDNLDTTPFHAGEIIKAMAENNLKIEDLKGDLVMICADDNSKRKNEDEITLFKSTGMALEDLVIAGLLYEIHQK